SLRVNPGQLVGLRSVSFQEALQRLQTFNLQPPAGSRAVLAFAFADQPVTFSVSAERRKPYVTARQLLAANIEAGSVSYTATFFYDIRYSAVKSLRIDLPSALAAEIHNDTTGIQEKVIDPPPADVAEGYTAWSLTGETEMIGAVTVNLSWEEKLEKLEIGKSVKLSVPR